MLFSKVYENLNYNIYVTSRYKHKDSNNIKYFTLEATKENSWLDLKEKFNKDNIVFDIILNTIGILHDEVNNIYLKINQKYGYKFLYEKHGN